MKKLVVITGASSGFGAALARMMSQAGYSLLLLARRVERLEAMNLPNTLCRNVDVRDYEAFEGVIHYKRKYRDMQSSVLIMGI